MISDLHLSDDPARSTINVPRLLGSLTAIINEARRKGVREVTLVLLGDIFETLKSEVWVNRGLRPWEDCTDAHVTAVADIVGRMINANDAFFEGLAQLLRAQDGPLRLVYIPGNHDRPLATPMGRKGREQLLAKLPALRGQSQAGAAQPSDSFPDSLVDEEHELIAQHGHEFDRANRYDHGLVAVGDAIVIEFVQRLPMRVRQRVRADGEGDGLGFLDEMDNVRPHSLKVLMAWIDAHLAGKEKMRSRVMGEIEKALRETLDELLSLKGKVAFGSFAGVERRAGLMLRVLRGLHGYTGLRPLARLLPDDESSPPYPDFVLDKLYMSETLGSSFRYFVCGHTHQPAAEPLDLGRVKNPVRYYLNTGTWRRVHQVAGGIMRTGKVKTFSTQEVGCVLSIYNRREQSLGHRPFELHRLTMAAHE